MLLDLIFPKFCISCNQTGSYLCPDCRQTIIRHKQTCIVCKKISPLGVTHPECRKHTHFDGIIIATEYKSIVKKALHSIKYRLNYDVIQELLNYTLISDKIKSCIANEQLTFTTEVPTHPTKYNFRGFNQSKLICQWLERNYAIPHHAVLSKIKSTQAQMHLNRYDRLFNLTNAFACTNPSLINHANVLLVDDVTTTASTLEEAARVLKVNNAAKVWALVIASSR